MSFLDSIFPCLRKRSKPKPPPTPPMPAIALGELRVDSGLTVPRRSALLEEVARVTAAWHSYFLGTTFQGVTWPTTLTAEVWVRDTDTNSWEGHWRGGRYSIWVHGRLERDAAGNRTLPSTEAQIVAAVGHRLCHALTGKGNASHDLFRQVAGR